MSMPVMGGVPLIETMNRLYPDCEIIAISGYDDFDYVSNSTLYIHQQLTSLVSRINITARKYMGFQVNIALSRVCDGFERIPEAYASTRQALENRFYDERQKFVWAHSEPVKLETQLSLSIKDEEQIQIFLEDGNEEQIQIFLDELFEKCCKDNVSIRSVQVISAELVSIAIQFCRKKHLNELRDELGALQLSGEYAKKKFSELRRQIKDIYIRIIRQYKEILTTDSDNPYVKKAMQYVYANFRRNISLTEVAEFVGVSSQYLSRLIHEECQKSFSELLNGRRVEAASEMIRRHEYTVKEIAEKTGFSNYNYFFKVFKEMTGMTPNEYEKKHT